MPSGKDRRKLSATDCSYPIPNVCRMHNNFVLQALLVTLTGAGFAGPGAAQQQTGAPRSIISPARLRQDLYRLADDSMMGREPGGAGNFKAAAYVAEQFRKLGLRPAGDSGTWFQYVPLATARLSDRATLDIEGTQLKPLADFLPGIWLTTRPLRLNEVEAIYGGDARDSTHWISARQAQGKVVVLDVRSDAKRKRTYQRTGAISSDPRWERAAALFILERDLLDTVVVRLVREGTISLPKTVETERVPPLALLTPEAGAALFASPVSGLEPGAPGRSVNADWVVTFTPLPYPARNVVAILPGRDARLRGEYISLSAHNDHVGFNHSPVEHDSIRTYNHVIRPMGADSPDRAPTKDEWERIDAELRALRAHDRPTRSTTARTTTAAAPSRCWSWRAPSPA